MAQESSVHRTVLHEPKLSIFGWTFQAGLDPINANLDQEEILRLRDINGATIVLSTAQHEFW